MAKFSNTQPFLQFGGKIDPLSEIRNVGILTTGNVVWVKHPSDADYLTVKESVGNENLFDTIQTAIDSPQVRNGKNDYVVVCPRDNNSAWSESNSTAIVQLNKDNVHLVALGAGQSFGSASAILELPGTAGTIGTFGAIYVTGDGCEVGGFFVRGTAGTSAGGSLGAGTVDGEMLGGFITVGTTVQGLDLHDFRAHRAGAAQWDGGTTGLAGTPKAAIMLGSGCQDITIRNGYVDCGTQSKDLMGLSLPFNGQNIKVSDVVFVQRGLAAASKHIVAGAGTIPVGIHLNAQRVTFVNTSGTTMSSAFGGTMAVGAFALVNECPTFRATESGTPGSTLVTPLLGVGTITTGGVRNPYIATGTAAVIPAGGA